MRNSLQRNVLGRDFVRLPSPTSRTLHFWGFNNKFQFKNPIYTFDETMKTN